MLILLSQKDIVDAYKCLLQGKTHMVKKVLHTSSYGMDFLFHFRKVPDFVDSSLQECPIQHDSVPKRIPAQDAR